MQQFGLCSHPEQRQADIGEPTCYMGTVAVHPYTDENRAAHGNIHQLVECGQCGGQRYENRNQWHVEVSPWRDARGEREAAERQERVAEQERAQHVSVIRQAYGRGGDLTVEDGLTLLVWPGRVEIVIGLTLGDAARRADIERDRTTILRAMREHSV